MYNEAKTRQWDTPDEKQNYPEKVENLRESNEQHLPTVGFNDNYVIKQAG